MRENLIHDLGTLLEIADELKKALEQGDDDAALFAKYREVVG